MFSKMLRPVASAAGARLGRGLASAASAPARRRARVFAGATGFAALTAAVAVATTGTAVDADGKAHHHHHAHHKDEHDFPADAKQFLEAAKKFLGADSHLSASADKQVLWNAIRKDIEDIIEDEDSENPGVDGYGGNSGGGGDVGPMFVRLAWHCSGSYDKETGTGGSNGATMRFSPEADHGANAGLGHARALLEPVKAKYGKYGVTYADIYVFAGNVAIEAMGGPALKFRPGRTDAAAAATPAEDPRFSPDGRLPDADGRGIDPAQHLRDIFHRMGFTDREIVTLSGGHALGRCHTDRSGYWGPWTNSPTTFSNQFFVQLEEQDWFVKRTHKGKPWTGPLQYEDSTGSLMMLPTDLCLKNDRVFRPVVAEYYKDEEKFFTEFAAAWTILTELGCEKVLDDVEIINLDAELPAALGDAQRKIVKAVESFRDALGEKVQKAKKTGWFW